MHLQGIKEPLITNRDAAPPGLPELQNGDRLHSREFLRRYESMPEVKKAELIEGIVYMGSPVSAHHAEPDSIAQLWVATYAARTPGVRSAANMTVILDPDNTLQPDALLRILPEHGGRCRLNEKKYILGAPELVVEIAATTASVDLHSKKRACCRNGVREYVVWRALDGELDWFVLRDDEDYYRLTPGADGGLRSAFLPGLHLDVQAAMRLDGAGVLAALNSGLAGPEHVAFAKQLAAGGRRRRAT